MESSGHSYAGDGQSHATLSQAVGFISIKSINGCRQIFSSEAMKE